ncbi:MAG: Hpt domain-containing protein [Desulfobacteraceae bacterium]|nr:Hpt domain-containing protein [Desulfobacteraceae bacterium]
MNLKELSKNLGLDEDEYMELLELFFETSMADLNQLQRAIETADAEKVASIAHSFKGAAVNLGLNEFVEIAKDIAITASNGQLEDTARVARTLKESLDSIAGVVK